MTLRGTHGLGGRWGRRWDIAGYQEGGGGGGGVPTLGIRPEERVHRCC